jgi:hypothetical protein
MTESESCYVQATSANEGAEARRGQYDLLSKASGMEAAEASNISQRSVL